MRVGGVALGVALTAGATIASAAVTESQFPPRTVRDLIEICAPAIAGNAGLGAGIGAVAGLAGGLIYDKVKKDQAASYSAGYQAGAARQPPNSPQ